jgi:hypothetical protein
LATLAVQRPVDSWRDADRDVFPTRMHDLSRRLTSLEALVAAEKSVPETVNGKQARLVSMSWPDGKSSSEVLWTRKAHDPKVRETFKSLSARHSETELKELFVLLAEQLLDAPQAEKDDNAPEE